MKSIIARLRARHVYNRNIAELSSLPSDIRADLHLDAGRIAHLAHKAAYGA
ncbi:MAG: hypothetical protein KGN33_08310 [Paracoccaceae bacterium]|nr:hypothetical protein [Paracoccaceae bacterium]